VEIVRKKHSDRKRRERGVFILREIVDCEKKAIDEIETMIT